MIKICSCASERFHNARPESFRNGIMPIVFHPAARIVKLLSPKKYLPEVNRAEMQSENQQKKKPMFLSAKERSGYLKADSCLWHGAPRLCANTGDHIPHCEGKQHKNTHMTFLSDQPMHLHWFTEKRALTSDPTKSDHEFPSTQAESLHPESSKRGRPEVTKLRPDNYLYSSGATASSKNQHSVSPFPPRIVITPLQPRTQDDSLATKTLQFSFWNKDG